MIIFRDGPAQKVTLKLGRAPIFLRVVRHKTKRTWDACNELHDTPQPEEEIHVYRMVEGPFTLFVRPGGMTTSAVYAQVTPPPSDSEVRETDAWMQWTIRQTQALDLKAKPSDLPTTTP